MAFGVALLSRLSALLPYLAPYRWRYVGGLTALILRGVLGGILPYILGKTVDALSAGNQPAAERILAILLFVAVCSGIAQYAMRWILVTISRDVEYDLRGVLTSHIFHQDWRFFHQYQIGDLMARATNDLAQVRLLLGPGLMYTADIGVRFLAALAVTSMIDWVLTLLVFVPMPLISLVVSRYGGQIQEQSKEVQACFSTLSAQVHGHLSCMRMLRAYGQSHAEETRFRRSNADYFQASFGLVRIWRRFYPLLEFLVGISCIVALGLGGWRVLRNDITLGTFTMFLYFLAMLTWPMIGLGVVINIIQRGIASLSRLQELLRQKPTIVEGKKTLRHCRFIRGQIEWRNVTVRYTEDTSPALNRVSLRINEGETLALIGPVGSGKSTLANLVPRLLDPTEGKVLVDGLNLKRIPLATLRKCIGHIPQETFLFSSTIAENIRLGNPKASFDEILEAARAAMLGPEIEGFPDGLDAVVGERGVTLSGGQKQRVALARALLRKPRVIILDDATSSLDAETEQRVLRRLRTYSRNCTLLLVTHRVSSAQFADRIAVLDNGSVVDSGTHEELLRRNGLYAQILERQRIEEDLARR